MVDPRGIAENAEEEEEDEESFPPRVILVV